jgi:hypothetical protein
MVNFELIEKELVIIETSTNKVIWHGKPFDCPIRKIILMPGLPGCLVLLEYYEFRQSEYRGLGNLILLAEDGRIKWHAECPKTSDSYVDIDLSGDKLFASSWLGYLVEVNPENGKLLNKTFTK